MGVNRGDGQEEGGWGEGEKVPRNAANARQRTRMRVLSKAFGRLKLTLPWVPPDTKLSKLDTLRLAMSYIAHLQRTLEEQDEVEGGEVAEAVHREQKQPFRKKCWPYSHPDGLAGPTGQVHDEEEEQYFERGSQPICDTTMMFDIQ